MRNFVISIWKAPKHLICRSFCLSKVHNVSQRHGFPKNETIVVCDKRNIKFIRSLIKHFSGSASTVLRTGIFLQAKIQTAIILSIDFVCKSYNGVQSVQRLIPIDQCGFHNLIYWTFDRWLCFEWVWDVIFATMLYQDYCHGVLALNGILHQAFWIQMILLMEVQFTRYGLLGRQQKYSISSLDSLFCSQYCWLLEN